MKYDKTILAIVCIAICCGQTCITGWSAEPLRVGMIGLDTSHAPAFAKLVNQSQASDALPAMRVVAAFPGGSPDLPASRDRLAGFTKQLEEMQVKIVDSIDSLVGQVDAIMLMSVDGRKHLEQAVPVMRSGKPLFIDKPLAADLTEAIAIDLVGQHFKAKWFSSSSLRFSPTIYRYRNGQFSEKIHGAFSWGPCSLDATHTDLFWYGIHGVESLYTVMGSGCRQVVRTSTAGADQVCGTWQDGRIGTFHGIRQGASGYGLVVFGSKQIQTDAKYDGYQALVVEIQKFFASGAIPVDNWETLEIMTFMQAAQQSKDSGGQPVQLDQVYQQHLERAKTRVAHWTGGN